MKTALRALIFGVVVVVALGVGLAALYLSESNDETLIVDATMDTSIVPWYVADFYIRHVRKFDLGYRTDTGQTLLMFTAAGYQTRAKKPRPTAGDRRTLRLITFFADLGVDIDATDSLGLTALHAAVLANEPEVIRTLLKSGADANAPAGQGKFFGQTPRQFGEALMANNPKVDRRPALALLPSPRP